MPDDGNTRVSGQSRNADQSVYELDFTTGAGQASVRPTKRPTLRQCNTRRPPTNPSSRIILYTASAISLTGYDHLLFLFALVLGRRRALGFDQDRHGLYDRAFDHTDASGPGASPFAGKYCGAVYRRQHRGRRLAEYPDAAPGDGQHQAGSRVLLWSLSWAGLRRRTAGPHARHAAKPHRLCDPRLQPRRRSRQSTGAPAVVRHRPWYPGRPQTRSARLIQLASGLVAVAGLYYFVTDLLVV